MSVLKQADPIAAAIIEAEKNRQSNTLELIASENHISPAVLEALGSVLTDKYAEGYPGERYYYGNEHIDDAERLAIDRAKKLFGCEHANVQAHSGTNANMGVYLAALKPGDKILGMKLAHGGHLSHGMKLNFSGMLYDAAEYGVEDDTERLDMDHIREIALREKPAMIITGASAYPRTIDFKAFADIAKEVGCLMLADIAHIAGLVAAGLHPSPVPHCEFVTATAHKTLRGPRGGLIFCRKEWAKRIDSAIFPGIQGGPLEHTVIAKAVAFGECLTDEFRDYARSIIANAKMLSERLMEKDWRLVSGGTDNHLMLIDLRSRLPETTGRDAAGWLAAAGIISNQNAIPNDPRPPKTTSGIRLGTPALTSRGMGVGEMRQVADWIDQVLLAGGDEQVVSQVLSAVQELCKAFPVPWAKV